jgi:hypothetical protein
MTSRLQTTDPVARLSPLERAEFMRQGAKAALRGEPEPVTPTALRDLPLHANEPFDLLQARREAWLRGYRLQRHLAEGTRTFPRSWADDPY